MKTINLFEMDESVMIKVKVANVEIKKGEPWYTLKDPVTGKCFEYMFKAEQLMPVEGEEEEGADE